MQSLQAVDYTHAHADRLFAESLRDTGFGVLKNHPLSENRVQTLYADWQAFFDSEEKHQFSFDENTYDGFFPTTLAESAKGQSIRDLKEYFHFYLWGQCPESLKVETASYYRDTVSFACQLLNWVERYTPDPIAAKLSEPLSDMMQNSQQSLLRVLHYPPVPADAEPSAVRASAHEDINLLTVLPAANAPGLQVKAKDGSWLEVPCDFGFLIINAGDMLQEATNAYFPSTTHRVINPSDLAHNKSRISLPLFLHPRPEVVLSDRYTAQSYRDERLQELRESSS